MKNIDFKKLLVLIVIIAVAVLAIFGIAKLIKKVSGPSKDEVEAVEKKILDYYTTISDGYTSLYGGVDFVYDTENIEIKNLETGALINAAIRHALREGKQNVVDSSVNNYFKSMTGLDGIPYKASIIVESYKELFGSNLLLKDYLGAANFNYDFYYLEQYDVFMKVKNKTVDLTSDASSMDFKVIETKIEKDTLKTTVAVAYVYYNGTDYKYAQDKNGTNIVVSGVKEYSFPEDKVDEFNKYVFVTKKVDDKYILESIEKA